MVIDIMSAPEDYIFPFCVEYSRWGKLVQCQIHRKCFQSSPSLMCFHHFCGWWKPYKINECNADIKITAPLLIENGFPLRIMGWDVVALLNLFSLVFTLRILINLSMQFRYWITFQFMTIEFARKFLTKDFQIPTLCLVLP